MMTMVSKPAKKIDVAEAVGKSVATFRIEYPDDDRDGGAVTVRFTDGTEVCVGFKPLLAVRPSVHKYEDGDFECLKEYETKILHHPDTLITSDGTITDSGDV
jgi:hypothetical protein